VSELIITIQTLLSNSVCLNSLLPYTEKYSLKSKAMWSYIHIKLQNCLSSMPYFVKHDHELYETNSHSIYFYTGLPEPYLL